MVNNPEEWPYSRYPEYIGLRDDTLPETEFILGYLESRPAYKALMDDFKVSDLELVADLTF